MLIGIHLIRKRIIDFDGSGQKENGMKVTITDECIACGLCIQTCPEVFEMGDTFAEVKMDEVPAEFQDTTRQAAEECPVSCIKIE
jgi:ferredoxin